MIRRRTLKVALAIAPLLAGCAGTVSPDSAGIAPLKARDTAVGRVITDRAGYTLYTYKSDPLGRSECFGRCAKAWPPAVAHVAPPAGSELSVIERKDGVRQYAFRGKPLYRWRKDLEPGQATGHNVGEVWFVARP